MAVLVVELYEQKSESLEHEHDLKMKSSLGYPKEWDKDVPDKSIRKKLEKSAIREWD